MSYHVDVIGHLKHPLSYFLWILIVLFKLKDNQDTQKMVIDRNKHNGKV